MPLLTKRRVLAAKIEATPGTPIALTSGTDGMINAYDVVIDGDIPYNERVAQGAFGRQASNVGAYAGSVKFKVEAYGSGTAGTAPPWALVLLEACAMSQAGGLFTPISAGASQSTATIAVYEDGARKMLAGAEGTWTFDAEDGKVGVFNFDFKGIWQPVTDAAMFTPQFATVIPPRFAGATLTVGAFVPKLSKVSIAYGAKVELCQDATQTSGYYRSIITDRKVTGKLDPEMSLVASYDQFGSWLAGTTAALSIAFGASGMGFTIAAPVTQYTGIKEGDRNGKVISNEDFICCQNGSTPDSEITIQF